MKVYTYSEARRLFAQILDEARDGGEVRVRRQDGTEFAIRPVAREASPLDVEGAESGVSREEILEAIRESRRGR